MDKENVSYETVYLDGLLKEKNNLETSYNPGDFIELLRYFNIGKEFSPIAVEFIGDMIRTRVKHSAGDSAAIFIGKLSYETKEVLEDGESHRINEVAKIDSDGYLVLEPADTLKRIGTKYNSSPFMNIVGKENQKIEFSDEKGNQNKITPLDKTQVTIPAEGKIPKFDDEGWLTWPKMENKNGEWIKTKDDSGNQVYERALTKITINARELQKSLSDMKASDRDYVQFHFGKDKSWSQSGHLGKEKSDHESKTILDAVKVEGGELEIVLQSVFTDMIKVLNDEVEIYGDPGKPVIVLKKELQNGRLIFVVTQPIDSV